MEGHLQIFHVLKAVSKVAKEGMVQLLQHASLPYYVPHALGSNDCRFLSDVLFPKGVEGFSLTLIFPYVFQRKRQTSILPLHYTDFSECSFADHPQ